MKKKFDYTHLSTSEKIVLVEEIWDSIATETIALSKEHKDLLNTRLNQAESATTRLSWESIKQEVRMRRGK
jgi:putative addiction module component (TIGR02574 family)